MSSDMPPRTGAAPVPADDDHRYQAVQRKLKAFSQALDLSTGELEVLLRRMRTNAQRAENAATASAHADLDPKFVEMTNQVATALGGAATSARVLNESALEVSSSADAARQTHARLYGPLDDVRSGRPERTPKPGFFAR
jgi:phage protein D